MKYLILLLFLVSCGPYPVERKEIKEIIYVDKIPPTMIPFEILEKRVFPTDEQLEQNFDRYLTKIVFFTEGDMNLFFNDKSDQTKRYVKSSLGPISWASNVCSNGSGEIKGFDIAESDEDTTLYSFLFLAKGVCNDNNVACALIETQFNGDFVYELTEGGCDEFSFGYTLAP